MATNEVLLKTGTQLSFADHAGDFLPAAGTTLETGTPTDVDMATASLANGSAVNSDKVDLGATRAAQYSVDAAIEFAATPVAGDVVELYWSPSPIAAAANGNPGKPDGVDGAYTGDGGGTVAESVLQMQIIGFFVCTDLATASVQVAHVGVFTPAQRYGQLVVVNNSGAAFFTDDVESHVVMTPIIDDIQAAA